MTTAREIINGAIRLFGVAPIDTTSLSATTETAGNAVLEALRLLGRPSLNEATATAATSTMLEVVTNALRLPNLIGLNATPTAAEGADALTAFNEMQFGWLMDGVDVTPADVTLTSTFPLPKVFQGGVTAMLASRLAESYGAQITPQLAASAQRAWDGIKAAYVEAPKALAELNAMMASWASQGVDVGYSTALTMTSTLPLKQDFVAGTKAMLAVQLAESVGQKLPQATVQAAERGWQMLRVAYQIVPNALTALNDMMFGWAADGVDISHSAYLIGSTFALDSEYEAGTKAMLAVRMSSEFGMPISQQVMASAANGWERLQAAYIEAPEASFDEALTYMPSQRYFYGATSD